MLIGIKRAQVYKHNRVYQNTVTQVIFTIELLKTWSFLMFIRHNNFWITDLSTLFYCRAVARFLKNLSPISPIAENPAEDDLSLNKILEGKTRRISSRMFFETLVSSEIHPFCWNNICQLCYKSAFLV